MQSDQHKQHIREFTSHANCSECRADTERRFVDRQPWRYQHAGDYLSYVKPRLDAIRDEELLASDVDARIWYRKFVKALHVRISLKMPTGGRKYCDSYLERMRQFRKGTKGTDSGYLRQFASRGASCLDY
jgi:hypothetical protein